MPTRASRVGNVEFGSMTNLRVRDDIDVNLRAGLMLPERRRQRRWRFDEPVRGARPHHRSRSSVPDTTFPLCWRVAHRPQWADGLPGSTLGATCPVDSTENTDAPLLARINLGVGMNLAPITLTTEIAHVGHVDADDRQETFFHTGAMSARLNTEQGVSPWLSLRMPRDESGRGELDPRRQRTSDVLRSQPAPYQLAVHSSPPRDGRSHPN